MRVLDVGCGDGSDLVDLIAAGWSPRLLTGVEIYPGALLRARQRLPEARLLQANAAQLPFPAESFDAVFQTTVLSSVVDADVRKAIADEMWRVTRSGGLIISYDMRSRGKNRQLVGIDASELARLFGHPGTFALEGITLSLRIAGRMPRWVTRALSALPWLRSHFLFYQTRT
jgi:ubiquinone/menaquinone biosynthesis C-methylase UbiE